MKNLHLTMASSLRSIKVVMANNLHQKSTQMFYETKVPRFATTPMLAVTIKMDTLNSLFKLSWQWPELCCCTQGYIGPKWQTSCGGHLQLDKPYGSTITFHKLIKVFQPTNYGVKKSLTQRLTQTTCVWMSSLCVG